MNTLENVAIILGVVFRSYKTKSDYFSINVTIINSEKLRVSKIYLIIRFIWDVYLYSVCHIPS